MGTAKSKYWANSGNWYAKSLVIQKFLDAGDALAKKRSSARRLRKKRS